MTALRTHRRRQDAEKAAAAELYDDGGYVFCREDGRPYYPRYLTQEWERSCRAAGVPVIALHDARHTSATTGADAGVPQHVMKDRLGHASRAYHRRGLHPCARPERLQSRRTDGDRHLRPHRAAHRRALSGTPMQDLNLTAADTYLAAPVKQAADQYRICMINDGYPIDVPQNAVVLAQSWTTAQSTEVPAAELALATADAECQEHTRLVETWVAEFERRAVRWVYDNQARVLATAHLIRVSLLRARAILTGSASPAGNGR